MRQPKIGHRLTQPGDRRKAIAYWRRCAGVWMATRFASEQIEGWKPAERSERVVRFTGRSVIHER